MPLLAWLLLIIALAAWAHRSGRAASAWACAAGWLALPAYEVWLRRSCLGDCGIRVDLLVLMPVLLGLSVAALRHWISTRRSRNRGHPG